MSLAFAPAQPFISTPNQLPTLDAHGIEALLDELANQSAGASSNGSAMLRHDLPWASPAGPAIVLDGDDDDDDDDDEDDDFFEDDEDEEWEDDYEDDLDDDDEDDDFDDDFEDDDEEL